MSEEEIIKGLEWSQQQMRLGNLPNYNREHYSDVQCALNLISKLQKEIEDIKEYVNSGEFLDWHFEFKSTLEELEYRKDRINELLEENK